MIAWKRKIFQWLHNDFLQLNADDDDGIDIEIFFNFLVRLLKRKKKLQTQKCIYFIARQNYLQSRGRKNAIFLAGFH